MRNINNYKDFVNEELFKRIFNMRKSSSQNSKLDICVSNILSFLKDNDIKDWNDFIRMKKFDRDIVNKIIDSEVDNMLELQEIRFRIRLELSDKPQLLEYQKELENAEEYEKCDIISKKLNRRI